MAPSIANIIRAEKKYDTYLRLTRQTRSTRDQGAVTLQENKALAKVQATPPLCRLESTSISLI